MARPLRLDYAGALHLVTARGNPRRKLFRDDQDRVAFLEGLTAVCTRFDWALWAYCLMDKHYSLLVQTRQPGLSRGMREVNGVYTQAFNRRHRREGPVLHGRYKSLLIDADAYLLEVARYIVLEPVIADLCERASEWPWSSYQAVMGKAEASPPLQVDATLAQFGKQAAARRAYARFVESGVGAFDPLAQATGQLFVGDETFIARAMRKAGTSAIDHSPRPRSRTTLAQIERRAPDRDTAIRTAYDSGAFSLALIGEHFGLHISMISRIARQPLKRAAR